MTRIIFALAVAHSFTIGAHLMAAQDSTYDARALRVAGVLGMVEVYRGSGDANLLGRVGTFRGLDISSVVSSSPNAVAEARRFHQFYVRGAAASSIAIVSLSLANGLRSIPDLNAVIHGAPWGVGLLGLALGIHNFKIAYNALSKAIWWYNRDLRTAG